MSLNHNNNKIVIEYSTPEIIYGGLIIMLLPIISIGAIELFTQGNDKPLLTTALAGMFFMVGIYLLLSAYEKHTEIIGDKITVTTKPYFRKSTEINSYQTQDVVRVDYFQGQWSGGQSDPRSHIYLTFKNESKVKIDSQRMFSIPFANNNTSSLKSEAEELANLLGLELNFEAVEAGGI